MKLFFFFIIPTVSFAQTYNISLPLLNVQHPVVLDSIVDKWDKSFNGFNNLNSEEKELFYWTNYSRNNPRRFWDSVVVKSLEVFPQLKGESANTLKRDLYNLSPLPLLSLNRNADEMAQEHSLDIGRFASPLSHNSSKGETFEERFSRFRLKNCGGENISLSDDILFGLVLLYLDYNLPEAGHRKNLLSTQFSGIGVGATRYGQTSNTFFVQDFVCPQ